MFSRNVHWLAFKNSADAPTNAALQSPAMRLVHARCSAYALLAQAASRAMLGPVKLKKYERRFANMQGAMPADAHAVVLGTSSAIC